MSVLWPLDDNDRQGTIAFSVLQAFLYAV